MMKCTQCGNEYEGNFCPNCGASENPAASQQYVRRSNAEYVEETHITTTLEWFGWELITYLLPFIGVIIMLCCAKGKSARNYAKLHLILYILAVAIFIGLIALGISLPSILGNK